MNSDDITSFSYVYEGEPYAFEKEDDTWYYADDHSLNLNQERIKAMILKVAPLKADQVIENVTDMSQYGLANPERTIQYETADRSVIINVGNLNLRPYETDEGIRQISADVSVLEWHFTG